MTDDLDIAGLARVLHRSREWTLRHWRGLVAAGMPAPFVGGDTGRPWWHGPAIAAWKAGEAPRTEAVRPVSFAQPGAPETRPVANDLSPPDLGDRAQQLLASLG